MRGLICWDLDETLGWFRPCAEELLDRLAEQQRGWLARTLGKLRPAAVSEERPPVIVRPGIGDALARLGAAGFTQVVTTGSFRDYALIGLEKTGLREHFAEVFGREEVWDGHGKRYAEVLARFGVEPQQALIVGDSYRRDRDADHLPIAMIVQPEGHEEPAGLLPPLIEAMSEPDFARGFARLAAQARPSGLGRVVELAEVHASIDHWGDYRRGIRTPVASNLRAPAGGSSA